MARMMVPGGKRLKRCTMRGKRYTDEFTVEAVRQVSDRGYPVKEVAGGAAPF
jgi:transposase-like protein